MQRSRTAFGGGLYPEPAFSTDIFQYMLTNACPWLDWNLGRIAQNGNVELSPCVTRLTPEGEHILLTLMRPEYHSRWRMLNPGSGSNTVKDAPSHGATLDESTPRCNTESPIQSLGASSPAQIESPPANDKNQLPCQVSMDVDSVIINSDMLPMSQPIEVRAIPVKADSLQYSNKLYMKAGPTGDRVLLSKMPDCRFGRAGRFVVVNIFFPGFKTPQSMAFPRRIFLKSKRRCYGTVFHNPPCSPFSPEGSITCS